MDLSIIIVNYNVKYFLEQCLQSVVNSANGLETEIIVVDNNSADGSCSMIKEKFKSVKLIRNEINNGFSVANNQALKIAKGKYSLLLNPDTVLDENSLRSCFDFMESDSQAGAVGLRMLDGKGKFLPESKRALPTPAIAFYKIFGLSKIFPSSKKMNMYHLGHLDKLKTHEVDVLTGAFMFLRTSVLEKIGLLDEDFFMYGEDIDLSYRIKEAGFKIYYLPSPPIIHFKGESTKKSHFNYVLNFYRSMILFVNKHYSGGKASLMIWIINLAIVFRASLSYSKRLIKKIALPIVEGGLIYSAFYITVLVWQSIKFGDQYQYPYQLSQILLPGSVLITLVTLSLWGAYKLPAEPRKLLGGLLSSSILVLIIYSLLPAQFRFSRTIILSWAIIIPIVSVCLRLLSGKIGLQLIKGVGRKTKRIIVVCDPQEYEKIIDIINFNNPQEEIIGRVSDNIEVELRSLGNLGQIDEIVRINNPDEIVFSSKYLSVSRIIKTLELPSLDALDKKIARTESEIVIGSKGSNIEGEVYTLNLRGKS